MSHWYVVRPILASILICEFLLHIPSSNALGTQAIARSNQPPSLSANNPNTQSLPLKHYSIKMPPPAYIVQTDYSQWFCGHCRQGPMAVGRNYHCIFCLRQKDTISYYGTVLVSTRGR